MQDDKPDQRWLRGLALSVSAGLHALILALLVFGLPKPLEKPQDDQAVDVALVPPSEAPKAEPPAPAPPEPEKPQEKKAEPLPAAPPPAAKETPAPQSPIPSFNPVIQYGAKDSGPEKSPVGDSATQEPLPAEQQEPQENQAAAEKDAPAADDTTPVLALPDAAATPTARPAETAKRAPSAPRLKPAKKLFSPSATGDALATTAMGDLPRSARGATLCVSELREQLLRNAPPYFADLLPSSPLKNGTVIDVPGVAFRASGQWRDLSYRCEVDADATKVVSFAFRVGEAIPPSEWKRRGLPTR